MKVVRPSIVWLGGIAPDGAKMLNNIAEAGRICYQSEPRTSSEQFVRRRIREIIAEWYFACVDAEKHYLRMIELGASPQIARGVLNNSTKAQLAITMNLREWRHFFRLRCNAAAHPQMIEIAEMLLTLFKRTIPVVFDDIEAVKEGGASV